MNSKDTIHTQLEHLQMKYVGTGHADTTKFEWGLNIQRDSYASYIGHKPMLHYLGSATNQSTERLRYNLLMKMMAPIGAPPARDSDEEESD
jgi:splicing factor 3B subunit 5